ncbi:MAG: hypothetical protein WKF41_01415 [Gaiellaceae bacterium]
MFVGGRRPVRNPRGVVAPIPEDGPWGFYSVDEAAARYNASSPEETQDGSVAYARFPAEQETRYPGALLSGG